MFISRPLRSALFIAFAALCVNVQAADLESKFPSTIPGITIPNSHALFDQVWRGMAPRDKVGQLLNAGVTDFLIFKIDVGGEVKKQILDLLERGIPEERIQHIEFPWKNISDFRLACEQTVEALQLVESILASSSDSRKLFFHCTVGEDRTGYLAGLIRLLFDQELDPKTGERVWNIRTAFQDEMCKWGYAEGNKEKDDYVAGKVRESLTPLYLKMAYKISRGFLNKGRLDKRSCDYDPVVDEEFSQDPAYDASAYRCL